MALTGKSKLKDIFANEQATAIVQKHMPEMKADDPRMKPAMNMALQALLAFPQTKCPKDVRIAILTELEAANIEG